MPFQTDIYVLKANGLPSYSPGGAEPQRVLPWVFDITTRKQTQPIGRMAKPEEIAALAQYLCSDEASFVTGSSYPIDGGAVNLR